MLLGIIGPLPNPINGCSYANQILCKNLEKRTIDTKVINTSTSIVSSKQGTSFSMIKAFNFFKVYFESYKILKSTVVYITPGQTFFGILKYAPFIFVCIIFKKPYIIHIHGNYLGTEFKLLTGFKKKIFKYFISMASAGIVLSNSLKANFFRILPDSKVHVVENFVEESLFKYVKNKQKAFEKLNILYLSNLMREKGIIELLDALISLKIKGIDFKAIFAGGIEEEIRLEIEKRFKILRENVTYLGIVRGDKKNELFMRSNVFILPTYYKMEGQPISILEAMASGNIIVTTKHAGIPDIVTEENGFFVEPKSSHAIVDQLCKINERLLDFQSMSKLNMVYAKENFTEEKFSSKVIAVINGI